MSGGLSFDEWIGQVATIMKAAHEGVAPGRDHPDWKRCWQEGNTPLQAVLKLASGVFTPEGVLRAKRAATKLAASLPDYLEITRSIAGG